MKTLLEGIIEGFVREAPRKERQPGDTWQTDKGWAAKSMDTSIEKPVYGFKDEPSAKAWATGRGPAPDDVSGEQPASGEDDPQAGQQSPDDAIASDPALAALNRQAAQGESPPEEKPDEKPEEEPREQEPKNLKQIFGSDLLQLVQQQTNQRRNGIAGLGGPVASWGETLFATLTSELKNDSLLAVFSRFSNEKSFDNHKNLFMSDGKIKRTPVSLIRKQTAQDLGWDSYNDDDPNSREFIAQYLASRESYVDKMAEDARSSDRDHVYFSGFGGNRNKYEDWLRTSFDGAIRLQGDIRAGRTKIDSSNPWFVFQTGDGPNTPNKKLEQLMKQKLESATSPEEEVHYQKQIELLEKFNYADTIAVGQDSGGRLVAVNISNKLNSNLKDPHNSSTPNAQLDQLVKQIESSKISSGEQELMKKSAGRVRKFVEKTMGSLSDLKSRSTKFVSQNVEITDQLVRLADSEALESRMDKISDQAWQTKKGSFGNWLAKQDPPMHRENFDKLKTRQKLELAKAYMVENPTRAYATFTRAFIKMGEEAKKSEWSKFGGDPHDELKSVVDAKTQEAESIEKSYSGVVSFLERSDEKIKSQYPWPEDSNGPHTQTYIQSVLNNLHLDKYITNYDEDVRLAIGAHSINPKQMRETLASMVGLGELDLDSEGGKNELIRHVLEKSKIDSSTGGIILKTETGDCVIANDVYRTAGAGGKVSTGLGECFREALRNSQFGASGFSHPDISKISQQEESAPPELRKLIRDIALWKLGKYGN